MNTDSPLKAIQPPADEQAWAVRARRQFEAEQLLYAYVEYIDDDRLEELPELFTEDGSYQIISRENVERGLPAPTMGCSNRNMLIDRIVSLRHANIYSQHAYRHVLSNVRVKAMEGDEALVQSNYVVMATRGDGIARVYSTGKYVDRLVFEEDGPKFKQKRVIFDTQLIDSLLVRPL